MQCKHNAGRDQGFPVTPPNRGGRLAARLTMLAVTGNPQRGEGPVVSSEGSRRTAATTQALSASFEQRHPDQSAGYGGPSTSSPQGWRCVFSALG